MSNMDMYGLKITPMPKSVKPKMMRIKRNKEWEKKYLEIIGERIKKSKWKVPSFVNRKKKKNEEV